ncbi:MAG: cation-transporting P-type ATPase [Aggregatilineales bacterium]
MIKPISLTAKRSETVQTLATDPLPTLQTKLATSANGLSQTEAQARLGRYGYNELPEKVENPLLKFLSCFWGLSPWMIGAAAILSALMGRWADFSIIIILLIVYGIVRFVEQREAGYTITTVKPASKANVKRDGRWRVIAARELVPGDLIRLRIGNIVPADARVLDGEPVQVNQTAWVQAKVVRQHALA